MPETETFSNEHKAGSAGSLAGLLSAGKLTARH